MKFFNENQLLRNNNEALFLLANSYLNLGNKDKEALTVLGEIEKSNHFDKGKIKNIIGTIHWKLGDEETALKYLEEAIFYEPRNSDAKLNLGIIIILLI